MSKEIKILELFAGVGGFRIGLENANKEIFKTKWSNQWEPSKKSQDAFEVYNYHFTNSENINEDISKITNDKFKKMNADMIVGGFPCQDYSVARSKKNEQGIEGKKGVLFWEIIRATEIIKPKYLILENVDRLLKSPSKQRGRDFAIMLSAFNNLNYSVEWRVINAADYGGSQRRRRVFFFIFRNDLEYSRNLDKEYEKIEYNDLNVNEINEQPTLFNIENEDTKYDEYIFNKGLFARQFPIKNKAVKNRQVFYKLSKNILEISEKFSGTVWNTGIMRHGKFYSIDTQPTNDILPITLGEILQDEKDVDKKYFITDKEKLKKFEYLRGSKKIERTTADGHKYIYSEGGMSLYENLALPARTMLTSEGTVNRSTHFLNINNKYRFITPIEAERLQNFPDNWTKYKKDSSEKIVVVSDKMRMFFMGNALVTSIVKKIGEGILNIENEL